MDEREKRKKILFTILGIIILILLFFWIKSCSGGTTPKKTTKDITSIDVKTESVTLTVGESDKLSFTIIPSTADETTRWITSDDSVVSVDTRGNIQALKPGNAIVSLVSESGVSDYAIVKVVSKETVDGKTVTIGLTEKDVSIKTGSTKKILFDITPIDTPYNEVLWESSNNLVATVTNDGTVTGLRSGVTTITLKVILNDNSTVTDSATLTVEENASLYLTSTIGDIKEGEVIRAVVALSDASMSIIDGTVKSTSEKNATIANITSDANYLTFDIKGVKKGNTTLKVSATTSDGKDLSLDVPIVVVGFDDLYISSGDKELVVGETFTISGRMEPSVSGALDTICTSSSTKVATVSFVDATGEYNGACQITALKNGTSNISISIGGKKKTIKITVNESGINDPSNPDNPGGAVTGTDTDSEIITDTTLTAIEATLSKTEYQRNEAMGTLTVYAIDGASNKTELSPTDYVMINDFDSSTLGNKTLNIAYTKGDVTKVTSVSYSVAGSSGSSGGTSGKVYAGTGGYSGGGGGGDTIKYTVSDLKLSDDAIPQADGSFKGEIGIEAVITGEFGEGTHWLGVVMECSSNEVDCTPDSEYFVQARVIELEYTKGHNGGQVTGVLPSTIDAENVSIAVGGSWESLESLIKDGKLDKNGVTTSSKNAAIIASNTFFGYNDVTGKILGFSEVKGRINISTVAGVGVTTSTNSECGTLVLKSDKSWYSANDSAKITISASGTNGSYVSNLQIGSNNRDFLNNTRSITTDETISTQNGKTLTVTAMFNNSNGQSCPGISKTITLNIDDEKPKCTAVVSNEKNYITVTGWDNAPGGGIGSVTGTTGQKSSTLNSQKYTQTIKFPVNEAKIYNFTAKDAVGNTSYCQATIEPYECYRESACGTQRDNTAKACERCELAGCDDPTNDSIHSYYQCNAGDESIYLWIDKPVQIKNDKVLHAKKFDYQYEDVKYNCEIVEGANSLCAKKGVSVMITATKFRQNCQLCGCNSWSSFNNSWKRAEGIDTTPLSDASTITAFNTAKSKYADCSTVITDTVSGWKCGKGAELGSNPPKECKE